jgi:ComF family protein
VAASPWSIAGHASAILLGRLGHALSCAFLPSVCVLCDSPLPEISSSPVCRACWLEIPLQREHICIRCGEDLFEPVTSALNQKLCRACRLAPPAFVRAVSFGVYDGSLRRAIHALKFERITTLSRELGARLATAISQMAPEVDETSPAELLVVPVPLHRARQADRGFNQARNLAAEALHVLHQSHPEWRLELSPSSLMRQRATESQSGLTPRQRRQNLRGAFFVSDAAAISGRHILLVDDIFTTGATARACSKALIDAGAASVRVATLARAQLQFPVHASWSQPANASVPGGNEHELPSNPAIVH